MLFDMCCLTKYSKWERKSRKGKQMKSTDIYFQWDFHSELTVSSNIWIIKKELISGKISILFFNSQKYDAWEPSLSPMFYVEDFF